MVGVFGGGGGGGGGGMQLMARLLDHAYFLCEHLRVQPVHDCLHLTIIYRGFLLHSPFFAQTAH